MNPFESHLEALDRKSGRTHTIDDWRGVGEKSLYTPAALTDDDLIILTYFGGEQSADSARTRRAQALTPPSTIPDPVPAAAPVMTKKLEAPAAVSADDGLTWEEYVAKHGRTTMTLVMTDALINSVVDVFKKQWHEMNERTKERNARLDALENRVLELEAARAAVTTHGDH